jgi:predicted transcriptional regulator
MENTIKQRIKTLGKNQMYFAKKMNRTQAAISRALNGELEPLYNRIVRHIEWLESKQGEKQ